MGNVKANTPDTINLFQSAFPVPHQETWVPSRMQPLALGAVAFAFLCPRQMEQKRRNTMYLSDNRRICRSRPRAASIGKSKNATMVKITSWSIRADVVRKLDRGELEPEAITSNSHASEEAPETTEHAPF